MIKGQFIVALAWNHFLCPCVLNYCILYTRANGHGQLKHLFYQIVSLTHL